MSQLRIKYLQFLEQWRREDFLSTCGRALGKSFYKTSEMVPAEKSLETLREIKEPEGGPYVFIDIGPENFSTRSLLYPRLSRYEYAKNYFRKGYRMIAMVRDQVVVGDIWYVSRKMARDRKIHSDLLWFKIDLADDEIYLFDMYLNSDQRGGGLATYFHGSVLKVMRDRGVRKAYGCFEVGNIPAMWMHRLVGYRELQPHVSRRFLRFYEIVRAKA
jgi:GNAT superfamily N-acetyltransferase